MKIDKKRSLWIGLALVALVVLAVAAKPLLFPAPKPPSLATATTGDLERTVLATGSLEPLNLVSVGAQASGQLTALHVALGDTVHKGDLIAEIDSASQRNSLLTAEATLRNVEAQRVEALANLAQADLAFRRQAELIKSDAVAHADYETAEATDKADKAKLAEIDAQIASAKVSVETARVNLGYTRIVAPIDGTVLAIVTKQGQTVNAATSTPTIIKLGQLDTMTVKAQISEADVIKVKPGQDVYFTILGEPDRKYYAKLRAVEPAPVAITDEDSIISSSTSTTIAIYYNGRFEVPNPDRRLRTFMTAQVTIVTDKAKNAVIIPTSALGPKTSDGGYMVLVMGADGRPRPRRVTIGINTDASAQVLSGLKSGEKLVLTNATSTSSGDKAATAKPGGQGGGPPPGGPLGF
jgi:membrane fusion protein, macrolide-specific efflux system